MRNLIKVWKTEMGLSLGDKAYYRGSIPVKFEILQSWEHCYFIYLDAFIKCSSRVKIFSVSFLLFIGKLCEKNTV